MFPLMRSGDGMHVRTNETKKKLLNRPMGKLPYYITHELRMELSKSDPPTAPIKTLKISKVSVGKFSERSLQPIVRMGKMDSVLIKCYSLGKLFGR